MKQDHQIQEKPVVIAAFYHFVALPDYEARKAPLLAFCKAHGLKGTILLASEGINATVSGTREGIDALLKHLRTDPKFMSLEWKESFADVMPFDKMKVRLKQEIVRMGVEDLDVSRRGHYVPPQEWDALISDPEVITVDTRNIYETRIGSFEGAVDPKTRNFREFPAWAREHLDPQKHKKVAMYCTGGIRCEKSTALLKDMGFDEVYHLQGGILKYLEETGNKNQKWQGECFVFDERVAVDDGLFPTGPIPCERCGGDVITEEVKASPEEAILCRKCAVNSRN